MLADDGTVILKFFLHISEEGADASGSAPSKPTRWKPGGSATRDWVRQKKYDEYLAAIEEMLELTESEFAPWTIVEATSKWYARKKIFDTIMAALEKRLGANAPPPAAETSAARGSQGRGAARSRWIRWRSRGGPDAGNARSHPHRSPATPTCREVTRRQIQLRELGYQVYLQKRPVMMVFEGWDAAGKGGAIKRITEKLDPRGYVVYPDQRAAGRGQDPPLPVPLLAAPCRSAARSPSSTAPGTAACWWNAWKASRTKRPGNAPTRRSTPSSASCAISERFSRSSGSTSPAKSSCAGSRSARPSATKPGS